MDKRIFHKLFGSVSVGGAIVSSFESEDDIGVVLRIHLITEAFLEAFICAAVGNEKIFDNSKSDAIFFKLNYHSKLGLAYKLGLPVPAYKVLEKLNSLRNKLAHRIDEVIISDNVIATMANFTKEIDGDKSFPLIEEKAEFFKPDGTSEKVYSLSSPSTPNRIKLLIVMVALIRRTDLPPGLDTTFS